MKLNNDDNLYKLRYVLVPQEPKQKRLEMLLDFCEKARVDGVMLFILPEEYNTGLACRQEYTPWVEFASQARQVLADKGYTVEINPWYTLVHCDRGRGRNDLKYRRMVLANGEECSTVACPLCEDWKNLFITAYTDYAKAGFKTLWIEDDWRFHNHSYGETWGGCFCDEHIKALQKAGAIAESRLQLIENLNSKGIHSDRLIWREVNALTHINLAKSLRQALDAIDSSIKIGLMTSNISEHTREGRNWEALIEAFGGKDRVIVRPHGGEYQECCQDKSGLIANLSETLSCLPKGVKTFFEIENFPMSSFIKSNHQTAMQMAQGVEGGCNGLALDVLDFLGTGADSEPKMASLLANFKDRLLSIRKAVEGSEPVAIKAILPLDTTEFAPGTGQSDVFKLPSFSYGWFCHLQALGYPCENTASIDELKTNQIYALSGQAVWAIHDDMLETMLAKHKVLLDGCAADIILRRGFGALIGIKSITKYIRCEHNFSFEEHTGLSPLNIPERATINPMGKYDHISVYTTYDNASVQTVIKDCHCKTVGSGAIIYDNPQGGSGLVLPLDLPCSRLFYSWARKQWLQRWLLQICKGQLIPSVEAAWMYISARKKHNTRTLFLANQIFEVYENLQVLLPHDWLGFEWETVAHSRNNRCEINVENGIMNIDTTICGNDWVMLKGKK